MHFDDRLATVLRMRADGTAGARVQYRQIVDLLGILPVDAQSTAIEAAFSRLAELAQALPAPDRVAILRDPSLRLRSPRLVAALATEDTTVAGAALSQARLNENEWEDLIPALPIAARNRVRERRDLGPRIDGLLDRLGIRDRGLPPAKAAAQAIIDSEPAPAASAPASASDQPQPEHPRPGPTDRPATAGGAAEAGQDAREGIGALVRRIEAFRRSRQEIDAAAQSTDSPRLPLEEERDAALPATVQAFDFATDAAGRVVWADPGVAPMAVGLAFAPGDAHGALSLSDELAEALRRRLPLRAARLAIAGAPAVSGDWQVDAVPAFDPLGGAFAGYRGRLRRPAAAAAPDPAKSADSEADRIRQALHELRTPVNAIQGFAEVIQQQLFGPTPHEYRALAASIAGDAARMLAAFEELERLAKLESGAVELEPGETDLAAVVETTIAQLGAHTDGRNSGFTLRVDDQPLPLALDRLEVERIVWRLLATLAGTCAPGEKLRLRLRRRGDRIRMSVDLPAVLAAREGQSLFSASAGAVPQVIAAGVFGVGFALRLVSAETQSAGGRLERRGDRLRIDLPGLTQPAADHSHKLTIGV